MKNTAISALLLLSSQAVSASLLGDTINGTLPTANFNNNGFAIVADPGIEFTGSAFDFGNDIWTADFFATGFTLSIRTVEPSGNIGGAGGNIWVFDSLDFGGGGEITGVSLASSTGAAFASPGIVFGPHSVTITSGSFALNGPNELTSGTFEILTSPVPVPAAFWLFGSALAGLGMIRKRRLLKKDA